MNGFQWFIRFDLPRNFSASEFAQNGNTYLYFEPENLNSNDGLQSEILTGRIVYKDKLGDIHRTSSLLVKVFPKNFQRSSYTELTFMNEIYVYNKIIPFFSSLNKSVEKLFPKFYFGNLIFGSDEDSSVVMENLSESGYRSSDSKIFLDFPHLSLMLKKLGEFHAYSYLAKNTQPKKFYSLVDNLIENNFIAVKTVPNFLQKIHEIYVELLMKDERYAEKAEKLKEIIKDADEFCEEIFNTRNEPVAVLCHGDFLRNNVLFKYDSKMNPIDMKFIDVANMRYCTPVVDLGLVLYMNTDQKTRDKYWDQLLDVYYESLRSTFPENKIPKKDRILFEFKRNILQPYFFAMFFLPGMMESERIDDSNWFYHAMSPEYEQYRGKPVPLIPPKVILNVIKKIHKGENRNFVLDVITDILNKNFI